MQNLSENSVEIQKSKPWLFQKGQSGNPLGKPKGCRNKLTRYIEHITQENIEQVMQKLIEKAKWGHLDAIELLLNKIIPSPKFDSVNLLDEDFSEISELKLSSKQDIKNASELIVKAMIAGKISPSEANQMLNLLERYREIAGG